MSRPTMKLNNVTVKYAKEEDGKSVLSASITEDQQKAIFEKLSKSSVTMPPQKQSGFLRKKPPKMSFT